MKKKKKKLNLGKFTISHLEEKQLFGGEPMTVWVTCFTCTEWSLFRPTKCIGDSMCWTYCATYECSMCPECEEPD